MNSDQDILKYLDSFSNDRLMESSALSSKFVEIFAKINKYKDQTPETNKLKKLNALRLLSSNTLGKTTEQAPLDLWNKAQSHLYKLLVTNSYLSLEDLKSLNSIVTDTESSVRNFDIGTGAGVYLSSELVEGSMNSHLSKIESIDSSPLLQAFEAYLNIVTIHPFENGNGRTARLAADFYLFKSNFLPVCFPSPIQSHVAMVKNKVLRSRDESYLRFLSAVEYSYEVVYES